MLLPSLNITSKTLVSDIVAQDYRTADVFRKYDIEYCCGGKWPLETACMMKGLELEKITAELQDAAHTVELAGNVPFHTWSFDFLTEYIVKIHHFYLKQTIPELWVRLSAFVEEHGNKYPELYPLQLNYKLLQKNIIPHLEHEEEIIFPYVCQISHAYDNNDSFASLLVKTLRKPIEKMMKEEHTMITDIIFKFRELTHQYAPPEKSCTSHKVIFSKLKELDNDLSQHLYLENEILFPRAIAMEKNLLQQGE